MTDEDQPTPEVAAARRDLAGARRQATVDLARLEAELDARPTADSLRTEAATVAWHVGRSWSGTEIEDGCPCTKAPCGLVDQDAVDQACTEHPLVRAKSLRQGHPADRCTGGAS